MNFYILRVLRSLFSRFRPENDYTILIFDKIFLLWMLVGVYLCILLSKKKKKKKKKKRGEEKSHRISIVELTVPYESDSRLCPHSKAANRTHRVGSPTSVSILLMELRVYTYRILFHMEKMENRYSSLYSDEDAQNMRRNV